MKTAIFAVIAMREVEFFTRVAQALQSEDPELDIRFISFFQPGNRLIRERGYCCYDPYEGLRLSPAPDAARIRDLEQRYGIGNLHRLLMHEKLTHGQYDDGKLLAKFDAYLTRLDEILGEISGGSPARDVVVFQELGGFIAPLSLYFSAKRHGVTHVFFEPSFFKGRLHYVVNGLGAVHPADTEVLPATREAVRAYLSHARRQRTPVVPVKDRHHFRDMGLMKVFNVANAAKFYRKLGYRWRGQRQEYEHPWHHALRSLRMLGNRFRSAGLYTPFDDRVRRTDYIYFPFHVQLDYALTVRSPEYLDQIALVHYLADVLPAGLELLVKEHPASVGGFGYRALRELVRTHSNVRVIHPGASSYDILDKARLVVTINSKVGAETLMLGKQVLALGDAFYSDSPLVGRVARLGEIDATIRSILDKGRDPLPEQVEQFFGQLWAASHTGELYVTDGENVRVFAHSLRELIRQESSSLVHSRASLQG